MTCPAFSHLPSVGLQVIASLMRWLTLCGASFGLELGSRVLILWVPLPNPFPTSLRFLSQSHLMRQFSDPQVNY